MPFFQLYAFDIKGLIEYRNQEDKELVLKMKCKDKEANYASHFAYRNQEEYKILWVLK